MSFRNASELVHSSSPLSGVRSEPGFGSTWESAQRAHRRWSKKDDAQKDVFCVITSYCMFFVYKNMTLIWHWLHPWEKNVEAGHSRSYSSSQEPTWHPRAHGRLEALHRFLGDGRPALRPLRESGCRNCSGAYEIQKGSAVTKPSELVEPGRTW